jgi:hypothetical protein
MNMNEMNDRSHILLIISKRWLAGCLLFFCSSCYRNPDANKEITTETTRKFYKKVDSVKTLARHGDLIFRNGTDEVSRAARSMNRIDTSFSHCGFVQVENDSILIYHAIGGHYNPNQRLRRDPIDSFLIPGETDKVAIYRYKLNGQQLDSLTVLIRKHYLEGLKFDLYFNFESDERMYCSEFVFKCLNRSLSDSLAFIINAREWPYGISPDDLFLNQKSHLVKRVDF